MLTENNWYRVLCIVITPSGFSEFIQGYADPKMVKTQLNIALWNWFQTAYQQLTNHCLYAMSQGKSLIQPAANHGTVWQWCFTFRLAVTHRFLDFTTGTEVTAKRRLLFLACHPDEDGENTEVPDGEIAVEYIRQLYNGRSWYSI